MLMSCSCALFDGLGGGLLSPVWEQWVCGWTGAGDAYCNMCTVNLVRPLS